MGTITYEVNANNSKLAVQITKALESSIKGLGRELGNELRKALSEPIKKLASSNKYSSNIDPAVIDKTVKAATDRLGNELAKTLQRKASGAVTATSNNIDSVIDKIVSRFTASILKDSDKTNDKLVKEFGSEIKKQFTGAYKSLPKDSVKIDLGPVLREITSQLSYVIKNSPSGSSADLDKLLKENNNSVKGLIKVVDKFAEIFAKERSENRLGSPATHGTNAKIVDENVAISILDKVLTKLKGLANVDIDITNISSVAEDVDSFTKSLSSLQTTLENISKTIKAVKEAPLFKELDAPFKKVVEQPRKRPSVDEAYRYKNMRDLNSVYSGNLYKRETIRPTKEGAVSSVYKVGSPLDHSAKEIKIGTEQNIKGLSKSLYALQNSLIDSLNKGFKEAKRNWEVVTDRTKADKVEGSFKLEPGGRQWTVEIANLDSLRRITNDFESSAYALVEAFKAKHIKDLSSSVGDKTFAIGRWLKTVSETQIRAKVEDKSIASGTADTLIKLKRDFKSSEVGEELKSAISKAFDDIDTLFKKTFAASSAENVLVNNNLVKKLALPAASVARTGEASFQTNYGAKRALPKFASFETGFEYLYRQLEKQDVASKDFASKIKKIGLRPAHDDKALAESLSEDMLLKFISIQKKPKETISGLYGKAAKYKEVEFSDLGLSPELKKKFQSEVNSAINGLTTLAAGEADYKKFVTHMRELNLTAYDVVKSLNQIESKNVYDVMNDVLTKGGKKAPISRVTSEPQYPRSVREFESAVGELEGILPLIEGNRPRRAYQQENVVNVLTRKGSLYKSKDDKLSPTEQKTFVRDMNLEAYETLDRMHKVTGNAPFRKLSSLGIPETTASNIEEYRSGASGGNRFLKNLQSTSIKMYSDDITDLAPFSQFQQIGRNISGISNALATRSTDLTATTPKLMSEREKALIESTRYGQKGYGYNVVAELRNTASNFEDQIVISGKLATAMTTAVKDLVKPSSAGRIHDVSSEATIRGAGITDIDSKVLIDKTINDVSKKYMEIFGVPEKYKGEADKALIAEVKKIISVVRGESVEVQQAKLAETFMNYFGRKFTTRYGSKGVSITPTESLKMKGSMGEVITKYGGKDFKIDPNANLGYKVAPKSTGYMAAELLSLNEKDDLRKKLVSSGNKFIIDLFSDPVKGIVEPKEAEETKKLYDQFATKWQKVFKSEAPQIGEQGLKQIRDLFIDKKGEDAAFELKPIDVRISSTNIGKRGLQTEFLEAIMNNITGGSGTTTLKKLNQKQIDSLLGAGELSKYSGALGYTGASNKDVYAYAAKSMGLSNKAFRKKINASDEKAMVALDVAESNKESIIAANLIGKSVDEFEKLFAGKDAVAVQAKRAAALEVMSSYYSTIVDEFGKKRKSLVGSKFLEIIEEPHENPEWTKSQIASGEKGARLDIPAFSAYSSIFGSKSDFMAELQNSLSPDATKHLEYLKALQALQPKGSKIKESLTKGLKPVDVKDLKEFVGSTGILGDAYITDELTGYKVQNPRSFSDTLLDFKKFPTAFNLKLPTGKLGPEKKPETEDFYVPGAAARQIYPEDLIAGEYGMDEVSRRLLHVTNMAKQLDEILRDNDKAGKYLKASTVKVKVGNLLNDVQKKVKLSVGKGENDPEALKTEAELESMFNTLSAGLSREESPDPELNPHAGTKSEYDSARYYLGYLLKQAEKTTSDESKAPPKIQAYATALGNVSDMLIGKSPGAPGVTEDQLKASTALSRASNTGGLYEFSKSIGIDVIDEEINKRVSALQRAKIDYYRTLADRMTGKTGTVNELFFTRKIPSVLGKAVTAVVDKTEDLKSFSDKLTQLEQKYGLGLGEYVDQLSKLSEKHGKTIAERKASGIPVLKQTEVGIPTQLASKIPIDPIERKFRVKKGVVSRVDISEGGYQDVVGGEVKSKEPKQQFIKNLAELIKYKKELESVKDFGSTSEMFPDFKKQLEELVPIVETIRYPFTGVSSIAPFDPKLIKPSDYEGLASHSLMVPGVPAGLDDLKPVIEGITGKVKSLEDSRERVITEGKPGHEEVVAKLTDQINELNMAISDVIPKYISQAQKLDFDGDQIEIHTAKTLSARKELEKHFKQFHEAKSSGTGTQAELMKRMLSEAADVKESGNYILGEAALKMEKKFEYEKGFDLLKKPFFTKKLDYLKDEEVLNILSLEKEASKINSMVSGVLGSSLVPKDKQSSIIKDISNIPFTDSKQYSDEVSKAIKDKIAGEPDLIKSVFGGFRKELSETKLTNAIMAQIYKLHVGPETESLYRVNKLTENLTGFSSGMLGIGGERVVQPTEEFVKRNPKALFPNQDPAAEFRTLMNEILRVGIQTGMDVKHAGAKPLSGEMVGYLSRGKAGADEFWNKVSGPEGVRDESFKGIRELSEDSEKAIRTHLGSMSTMDILGNLEDLMISRGQEASGLSEVAKKPRKEIIDFVVEKVGLRGFIEELSRYIEEEAVRGLIEQAKKGLTDAPAAALSDKNSLSAWARTEINKQITGGGIDLRENITNVQNPLYSSRTYFASPESELRKFKGLFGDLSVPATDVSKISGDMREDYADKYKESMATAFNIQRELESFSGSQQLGSYADMIRGTTEQLNKRQEMMSNYNTLIESSKRSGYEPGSFSVEKYLGNQYKMPAFFNTFKGKDIDRLSSLVGMPHMEDKDTSSIRRQVSEHYGKNMSGFSDWGEDVQEAFVDATVKEISKLEQLDTIANILQSKGKEGELIKNLLPDITGKKFSSSEFTDKNIANIEKIREQIKESRLGPSADQAMSMANADGVGGNIIGKLPTDYNGLVNVHIASVAAGATIGITGIESAGFIPGAPSWSEGMSRIGEEQTAFNEKGVELSNILKKASGLTDNKDIVSYAKYFSPSRLAGGGNVFDRPPGDSTAYSDELRRKEQVDELVKTITGTKPAASVDQRVVMNLGSAIHLKLQKEYEKAFGDLVDFEIPTEMPVDKGAGKYIGGYPDVVTYDKVGPGRKATNLIDIKTSGYDDIKEISDAIDSVKGDPKAADFEEIFDNLNDSLKRKLQDYYSQLNAYLKMYGLKEGELRFYDRENKGTDVDDYIGIKMKFSQERFEEDMAALDEARARVASLQGTDALDFKTTKRVDISKAGSKIDLAQSEIDRAVELAYDRYEYKKGGGTKGTLSNRTGVSGKIPKSVVEDYLKNNLDLAGLTDVERQDLFTNIGIEPGTDDVSVFKNLKKFHTQSKLYQKLKGVNLGDIREFPKDATKRLDMELGDIQEHGPNGKEFKNMLDDLSGIYGDEDFGFRESLNAWKLYRLAVGEFFMKKADEAYKNFKNLKDTNADIYEVQEARAELNKAVEEMQNFITLNLGKKSDVYTEDRRFVHPALAKAAGVYKSPDQIMQELGGPLGDDPKLIAKYEDIMKGLKGSKITPSSLTTGKLFEDFSDMDKELSTIISDSEKFKRMGPEVVEAWDFDLLSDRASRLREALQKIMRFVGPELEAPQKKNIENIIKYLKKTEDLYSKVDTGAKPGSAYGITGVMPVNKMDTPAVQQAIHKRNIQALREYMRVPEEEGGPGIGQRVSYSEKVTGQAGEVLKNATHHFKKYGEEVLDSGDKVGKFSEKQNDLLERMQTSNSSFKNATRRVVMWGAASRLIYGGASYLSKSVNQMADMETGIAQLRMVMSPIGTDFTKMGKSAVGFAKKYGVPVTDVLKSMKVFAQQGLQQEEVIDRTQTATLAANVTTLNAKDATEALTAAMKIFREEGDQSIRFLDSWSEVEAKHAITAEDMANAIKKSAAAAKVAGVTFDQLNGIVAAIGATTRQSGKEVGTSLRFIFRRINSEEGPKALANLPKAIPTVTGEGELRSGFDVLGDLAGQWKDLTSAQKLNVAQSIGGTRQYNALLVLMDQWDEVLRGIRNSTNSKGSAERRNIEIMQTYAKQLEQTKAAAAELKLELSKVVLPTFKTGLKALKFITEAVTDIPGPIKLATTSFLLLMGALAKGTPIIDSIAQTFDKGKAVISDFSSVLSKDLKIAKYEIVGKGKDEDIFGLKSMSSKKDNYGNSLGLSDFHSSLGKVVFLAKSAGDSYNDFLGDVASGTEKGSKAVEGFGKGLKEVAATGGAVADIFKALSFLTPGTIDDIISVGLLAAEGTGYATEQIGKTLGKPAGRVAEYFSEKDPKLFKSLAPLAISLGVAAPLAKELYDNFKKLSGSAQDFENSMSGARRYNEDNLKAVRDLMQRYDTLADRVKDINKVSDPSTKKRRLELGTYEAPLVGMQKIQKEVTSLSNNLAESNINLVVGYDKLGNAVLKTTGNFKSYFKELESLKSLQGVETEVSIMDKFVKDLTETKGSEKFKAVFNELASSFPVIGDLVARNIKVGPAKALEMASEDLNTRLNLKQKYPLSTAADKDIERLQGVLGEARKMFQESYSDFERVYSGVVSPSNLKNLSPERIQKLLTSESLKKAYELQLDIDPKFKLAKGVRSEDIMGKEVLTALNPRYAGMLDVNKEFTKANFETGGVIPRGGTKVFSGDIVTLMDSLLFDYSAAGDQAIVKMKETTDGVFDWVVEYFNTKTLKVEERPFSEVAGLVENIFPAQKIKEDIDYRMDVLNTAIAGAGAGLVGINKKDFKKQFSLGERFFSEIPTTTLLQGDFGFKPSGGYGKIPGAENFASDIKEFYFKPMEELNRKLEQVEKLSIEGIGPGEASLGKDMYDSISELLTVLKNNQVVLQFRAAFVDLMKEFSEGERILKQNLATTKQRFEVDKEGSGLMGGVSKGLEDYSTGVYKVGDLSTRQNLLRTSPEARDLAKELKLLNTTSDSQLGQLDSIVKARVNLDDIRRVASATGVALDKSNLSKYVEEVAKVNTEDGPFVELSKINTKVADNTSATVDRLDKLLENQGDPETIDKLLSSFSDNINTGIFNRQPMKIVNALERVAGTRRKAEGANNQELVTASNKVLDNLTRKLVQEVGFEKGAKLIDNSFSFLRKDFSAEEFKSRAFSGVSTESFLRRAEELGGEKKRFLWFDRKSIEASKELSKIRDLQESDGKKSLISNKTLIKIEAALAAASYLEKRGNNKVVTALDDQIKQVDEQIKQGKEEGKPEAGLRDLTKKREALSTEKDKAVAQSDFYGIITALSTAGMAASELGMAFGLTEKQVKALNLGAVGTYGAIKFATRKKEVPDEELSAAVKDFEKYMNPIAIKLAKGEKVSNKEFLSLGKAGHKLEDAVKKGTEEAFNTSKEKLTRDIKSETAKTLDKTFKEQEAGGPKDYNKIIKKLYEEELGTTAEKARRGIEVETGGTSRIRQIVAAYLAAGLADYTTKKLGGDKSALASLENSMAGQQKAITDIMDKYPEITNQVLNEMYTKSSMLGDSGESDTETVTKSLVQDTETEYKKVVALVSEYNKEILESHVETAEKIAQIQAKLADQELRQADKDSAYRAIVDEKTRKTSEAFASKYSIDNIIQKNMAGFAGEFAVPGSGSELSTQKRLYSSSDRDFKESVNTYSKGVSTLDTMRDRMVALESRKSEEAEYLMQQGEGGLGGLFKLDTEEVSLAKERYKGLSEELSKQAEVTDKFVKKLQEFAQTYMYLDRFSQAVYQLKDSLSDLTTRATVDWMPGINSARERQDRLLGGSSPFAKQAITPAQERAAAKVGVDLQHLGSSRIDVEYARLLEQQRTATGEEAVKIREQLADLGETFKREEMAKEQKRYDESVVRKLEPFKESLYNLEKVRTMPGIDSDLRDQISKYQKTIDNSIDRAFDIMPINQYRQELDKNRKFIGEDVYKTESTRLDDFEAAGIKNIYRGIPSWVEKTLTDTLPEDIREPLKDQLRATTEGLKAEVISDPIVGKLNETNSILKGIAEKEFGLSFDKPGIFGKLFGGDKYIDLSTKKKAQGGAVFGPGSSKSDSIPALLSNGEYVVKASSVKRLGANTLDFINSHGKLPGFYEGGLAKKMSGGVQVLSDELTEGIEWLKLKRAGALDAFINSKDKDASSNLGKWALITGGETAARSTRGVVDFLGAGIGAADYFTSPETVGKDISVLLKDIKDNVVDGDKESAGQFYTNVGGALKSTGKAFWQDIVKEGPLELIAGILGGAVGAKFASSQSTKISTGLVKELKAAAPSLTDQRGSIIIPPERDFLSDILQGKTKSSDRDSDLYVARIVGDTKKSSQKKSVSEEVIKEFEKSKDSSIGNIKGLSEATAPNMGKQVEKDMVLYSKFLDHLGTAGVPVKTVDKMLGDIETNYLYGAGSVGAYDLKTALDRVIRKYVGGGHADPKSADVLNEAFSKVFDPKIELAGIDSKALSKTVSRKPVDDFVFTPVNKGELMVANNKALGVDDRLSNTHVFDKVLEYRGKRFTAKPVVTSIPGKANRGVTRWAVEGDGKSFYVSGDHTFGKDTKVELIKKLRKLHNTNKRNGGLVEGFAGGGLVRYFTGDEREARETDEVGMMTYRQQLSYGANKAVADDLLEKYKDERNIKTNTEGGSKNELSRLGILTTNGESHRWGISTANEVIAEEYARKRNRVENPEKYMGVGPESDWEGYTDLIAEGYKDIYPGYNKMQEEKDRLNQRLAEHSPGVYKVSKNLIISEDEINKLKGIKIPGVEERRQLKDKAKENKRNKDATNILDDTFREYNTLPGYAGKVKKQYDRINDIYAEIPDTDSRKRILLQQHERLKALLVNLSDEVSLGGDLNQKYLREQFLFAMGGGKLASMKGNLGTLTSPELTPEQAKYMKENPDNLSYRLFDKDNPAYTGILEGVERSVRGKKYDSIIGKENSHLAFYKYPKLFSDVISGKLKGEDKALAIKKLQAEIPSRADGFYGSITSPISDQLEFSRRYDLFGTDLKTSDKSSDFYEKLLGMFKKFSIRDLENKRAPKESSSLHRTAKDDVMRSYVSSSTLKDKYDELNGMFKGGYVGTFHNGGIIPATGTAYVEKGELVLPRGFAAGGLAEAKGTSAGLQVPIIDVSSIISKLKDFFDTVEVKVEDLPDLKVGKNDLPSLSVDIGDAKVPVDVGDAKVPIDKEGIPSEIPIVKRDDIPDEIKLTFDKSDLPESIKVALDTSNIPESIKVNVDTSNIQDVKVKVDVGDSKVPVELPTGPIEVNINVDEAVAKLNNTIKEALTQAVEVRVTGDVGVGADREDILASMVSKVKDQLIAVKESALSKEEATKILGERNQDLDNRVNLLSGEVATLKNSVNRVVVTQENHIRVNETRYEEAIRNFNRFNNFIGIS